ncbi:MAG: hypothetical protein E6Q97_35705 [Desulfurellales bacterium]|nr:MAG: hypothetical protein E6Q97_35705 [Desulfurellales bacterium]
MPLTTPMIVLGYNINPENPTIRINTGAAQTRSLDLPAGYHFPTSDDLVDALLTALNENTDGVNWFVSVDVDGFLTITCDVSSSIIWGDALTTIDPTLYGFTSATTTGTTHTAPNAMRGIWLPGRPLKNDPGRSPLIVGALKTALGGKVRGYQMGPEFGSRFVSWERLAESAIKEVYADADRPYGALDWLWGPGGMATGTPFRFYPDVTATGPSDYALYTVTSKKEPWVEEEISNAVRYRVELNLREWGF